MKTKLKLFADCAKSPLAKQMTENKIEKIEQTILKLSSAKNAQLIKEQINQVQSLDGSFSQTGMW